MGAEGNPTVDASVIRLNKGLLNLSILHKQRIALAAMITEDRGAVEAEI